MPTQLNVVRVAETHRQANLVMEGGDPSHMINLARTAHQIVYANGRIMLDSGMDDVTHDFFGSETDPFYQDQFALFNRALE